MLIHLYSFYPVWHTRPMKTAILAHPYKHHRSPAEIISRAVWLYFRVCLSYRDVEELLFARDITVGCGLAVNPEKPQLDVGPFCGGARRPFMVQSYATIWDRAHHHHDRRRV